MEQVRGLVPEVFQNVSLFTLTEDVTLLVSKKGKPTLMCKKINENREVDMSHDHEKQRLIDPTKSWWNLLGLTSRDGKVIADMQHKFKQICKYVEIPTRSCWKASKKARSIRSSCRTRSRSATPA